MKKISMIIVLIVCFSVVAYSKERYSIEPFIIVSLNKIVGTAGLNWELSPTLGAGVKLPVQSLPLNLSLSMEAGKVTGKNTLPELSTLITSVLVEFEHCFHSRFRLIIGVGAVNMLITSGDELDVSKPFAGESENEFGFGGIFEPAVILGKFTLGLRFQDRHIFSAPEPVNSLSCSLIGGWKF